LAFLGVGYGLYGIFTRPLAPATVIACHYFDSNQHSIREISEIIAKVDPLFDPVGLGVKEKVIVYCHRMDLDNLK